ncbi:MAG: YitT family protein [Desulfovibrionaceae bacterium]|jgi:uncharacterized membrane-anchored protein YitT (DUF2179 family)|nr:YitT family protein [Desulfovibrionaceae bacterium]
MSETKQFRQLGKVPRLNFDFTYSVWWNLLLITAGSVLFAVGARSVAVPHRFIPGGIFGLGSLFYYATGTLDPATLYFLLNIPLFLMAWVKVSRRFFLYSLYAMVAATLAYKAIDIAIPIRDEVFASVAAGVICGAGAGLVLRSLGSNGGLDVFAVYLYQKYNIGIGKVYFFFNFFLFLFSLNYMSVEIMVASISMVFISSVTVEYTLSMFNQRKVVLIVSDNSEAICDRIFDTLRQSATFLKGFGAYTKKEKNVLMTVVNNVQLKKLEEIAFTEDPYALFIVENTFSVIGSSFSRRKIY